jgi:hypothetical protein
VITFEVQAVSAAAVPLLAAASALVVAVVVAVSGGAAVALAAVVGSRAQGWAVVLDAKAINAVRLAADLLSAAALLGVTALVAGVVS